MLDHASGIVIGATAVLGNDIYMLHSTTLGATGKPMGTRRRKCMRDRTTVRRTSGLAHS